MIYGLGGWSDMRIGWMERYADWVDGVPCGLGGRSDMRMGWMGSVTCGLDRLVTSCEGFTCWCPTSPIG